MVSDLASKLKHSLYCGFTTFHILSQHKESNMNIIFLNSIKKSLCVLSRAIIKGQCDHRTLFGRIIGTVLIEIVILHTFLNPACLHVSILIKTVCSSINLCKAIDIICTIRILIPFTVGTLMPAWCHNRKPVSCRCTFYRHYCSICTAVVR